MLQFEFSCTHAEACVSSMPYKTDTVLYKRHRVGQSSTVIGFSSGFSICTAVRSGEAFWDQCRRCRQILNKRLDRQHDCDGSKRFSLHSAVQLYPSNTWGRDTLIGPGLATWDLSFFKGTAIRERLRLQFRAELFNLLDRANFNTPIAVISRAHRPRRDRSNSA